MQGSYCSQMNTVAQVTIRLKGHPCKGLAFPDLPRKLFPSNSVSVQAHITHPISSCFVCSFERHFKLQPLFWGTYEYSCHFKEDWLIKPQIKSWLKAVQYCLKLDFTFISLCSFPKHCMNHISGKQTST